MTTVEYNKKNLHIPLLYSNKHGRKSKFKWPDTFLIESSGRRETPESIAEAKARLAKRHNATLARQHSTVIEEDEEDESETDTETEQQHKGTSPVEASSDTSDDEEFDDTFYASTCVVSSYANVFSFFSIFFSSFKFVVQHFRVAKVSAKFALILHIHTYTYINARWNSVVQRHKVVRLSQPPPPPPSSLLCLRVRDMNLIHFAGLKTR